MAKKEVCLLDERVYTVQNRLLGGLDLLLRSVEERPLGQHGVGQVGAVEVVLRGLHDGLRDAAEILGEGHFVERLRRLRRS